MNRTTFGPKRVNGVIEIFSAKFFKIHFRESIFIGKESGQDVFIQSKFEPISENIMDQA